MNFTKRFTINDDNLLSWISTSETALSTGSQLLGFPGQLVDIAVFVLFIFLLLLIQCFQPWLQSNSLVTTGSQHRERRMPRKKTKTKTNQNKKPKNQSLLLPKAKESQDAVSALAQWFCEGLLRGRGATDLINLFLTVMSYDATLTPAQCLQNSPLPWVLFSKHPTEGINVLLAPRATQNVQVKNIYTFYTEFSFCLLKIVLQILASFDIKITIVCKTLAMRRPMGHKQRLFSQNVLDPASFSFLGKQNKANAFATFDTLCVEPFLQQHRLGCLTCRATQKQQQHRSKQ